MLYPTGFLSAIGAMLAQIDFVGPRFIEGCETPLHFLSMRFLRPFTVHLFFRIERQTTAEVMRVFSTVFFDLRFPLPDAMQQDNDSTLRGCINQPGIVGRYIRWLCHNGVVPIFNAPKSPWNTGAVEGGNSVFDRKFWTARRFASIQEVDAKLAVFNAAYERYLRSDTPRPHRPKPCMRPSAVQRFKDLVHLPQSFLFLLRIVREDRFGKYTIEVLNRYIELSVKLKGQFVIVQIQLEEQWMKVWQERGDHTVLVRHQTTFFVRTGDYKKKRA